MRYATSTRRFASHSRTAQALRTRNVALAQHVQDRTRKLDELTQRLAELERMKDEFISRTGHELRTPLTNIKIYLELLETGKPENRDKYLSTLKCETDRLHILIEDLLQVRQLSLETFELEIAPTDIHDILRERLVVWDEQAVNRGLVFHTRLLTDPPRVLIDRDWTAQLLGHLVNNAINYTPAGIITLSTAIRSDVAGCWITVSVTDTGPGIASEELSHIFERFYRGHAAADYKTPGIGVGLAICREIVNKLNGRLTVQTEVGVGSTFTVWLRAA